MSWNDNAGGGSNNGQNPWGNRPTGGGGQEPPDLDEVVREMQNKMRGVFGGGGTGKAGAGDGKGGGLNIGILGLAALVGWMLMGQIFYTINAGENGVVLRFGEYVRTEGPGLKFKMPNPIETMLRVQVTEIRQSVVGVNNSESLMLTSDENIVDIAFTVQWRIDLSYPEGVRDYLFNVADVDGTVKAVAESAMREVAGTTDLQTIITTGRAVVSSRTRDIMQRTLNEYSTGVTVVEVQLQRADPPAGQVVEAFRGVDAARQDAEAVVLDAQAHANRVVPEARGDASRVLQEAQGYRDSEIARASGDADRFVAIYEQYALAPEVTRRRMYLETMEKVLGNSELMILDQEGGAVPYLPLDRLGNRRGNANRGGQ